MNVGSLFSGCLGLDLGLEAAGWEAAWYVENDAACQRVIGRRRPGVPIIGDVRAVDAGFPRVDLLAGGAPCQPVSLAGKGLAQADERWLWPEFARAVRVLRPRFVLLENVPGLARRGLGDILADLASLLYVGRGIRLRAADVGAPHGRERIFLLAANAERERWAEGRAEPSGRARQRLPVGDPAAPADTDGRGREQSDEGLGRVPEPHAGGRATLADAYDAGRGEHGGTVAARAARSSAKRSGDASSHTDGERRESRNGGRTPGSPYARPDAQERDRDRLVGQAEHGTDWGVYEPAIRRWEHLFRPAPRPVDDRGRLSPRFEEWMLGFPDGWTEGEKRTAALRMLGNAVQVQCGEVVGRMLRDIA